MIRDSIYWVSKQILYCISFFEITKEFADGSASWKRERVRGCKLWRLSSSEGTWVSYVAAIANWSRVISHTILFFSKYQWSSSKKKSSSSHDDQAASQFFSLPVQITRRMKWRKSIKGSPREPVEVLKSDSMRANEWNQSISIQKVLEEWEQLLSEYLMVSRDQSSIREEEW